MCARYSLTVNKVAIKIRDNQIVFGFVPRYNIAPSQTIPVIVEFEGKFQMKEMVWGWKTAQNFLINAKSETLQTLPIFRSQLKNRCLIPADAFYEWTGDKTPIRFTRASKEVFCFAGLWREAVTQPFDEPIKHFSVVMLTTTPNDSVARFHNRMPFIVPEHHYSNWVDPADADSVALALDTPDKTELFWTPLDRTINNSKLEGADLIRAVPLQKDLFSN